MPKSKRAKVVSLTQTDRKGLQTKKALVQQIHDACDEFARVFIFSVENMRNAKLKEVRTGWRDSRFFFGKNKVMSIAFGLDPESEYRTNMHEISKRLSGNVGVLFTNRPREDVEKWFKTYEVKDYARAGNPSTQAVRLMAGPLPQFSHALEPQLRKLGLPTSLKRGIVTLEKDYTICEKGVTLSPEQARLLKLFEHPMATFRINLLAVYDEEAVQDY
ncbi:mRNA turnover protein 4 mrt4 [Salpingoeca rosetta]|uniref:Ribosome assembly factor mrt4 n=1 Tax=Salpingoeca rosetta (strain ATCC 50818 / BSB-021) TaxID=946362 RepID=F2TXI5_SALR5|nr:mRNA turnover protein 4 mrt4 [Salpingoeca rosetta]EGD76094.1 mRNA turnover protein 4 mrt4 [Salpingoeca rosetta]|eukprot:XP_004998269.1 mRNA turnover protein 4 mrt4 [Salpingoeca rosetta]